MVQVTALMIGTSRFLLVLRLHGVAINQPHSIMVNFQGRDLNSYLNRSIIQSCKLLLSCCRTKVEKEVPYKSWSDFLKVASVPVTEVGGSSPGSSKPKRPKPFNITRTSFGQDSILTRQFHCVTILTLSLAFFQMTHFSTWL